jgi:fumarate hydratase subunit beta
MATKYIKAPMTVKDVEDLRIGDNVFITGVLYTARDAAHKRLVELLDKGEKLPFDPEGSVIYYVGPTPAPPGKPIGSAGPTTSYRMDSYAPRLIEEGVRASIGKGERNASVVDAMKKHKAVYFAALGGGAALISQSIKKADIIAFEDLGAEAVRRIEVVDFPCIVAQDCYGGNMYEEGIKKYRKQG